MAPHVLPHDDGMHFWWLHDCWDFLGEPPTYRRDRETETMLPIGPHGWDYNADTDTVFPSLLCYRCHTHGWWIAGQWQAC
jgi:hypothetical protein